MNDVVGADVAGLLQALVQQQTAMLQVQAESVRLQRILVERLLGAPAGERVDEDEGVPTPAIPTTFVVPPPVAWPNPLATTTTTEQRAATEAPAGPNGSVTATESMSVEAETAPPPPADTQTSGRTARYYQRPSAPTVKIVRPEDLELMRRLQEMRDAGDLILQFGPYKSMTLAQVAMHHPEYIRQLMTRAQRPEVRAAAGRLVEALDAAAEHKRRPSRGATRRGRSTK